jgi:hypothetical protein
MTEYEYEPVPGLPEDLPPGEEILWQGAPRWQSLARRAFHTRKVLGYFLLLWLLHLGWELQGGGSLHNTLGNALILAIPAALTFGILVLLARAMARSTLYTITNRRVVLRFGVALPMVINLPFSKITSASLRDHGDGTGDIPLIVTAPKPVPYFALWPHARPWYFAPAQPMLRTIPDAAAVAQILAAALSDWAQQTPAAPDGHAIAQAGPAGDSDPAARRQAHLATATPHGSDPVQIGAAAH